MKILSEILKNAPCGIKLWCDLEGTVTLKEVLSDGRIIIMAGNKEIALTKNGELPGYSKQILFPSCERDWKNWQSVLFEDARNIKKTVYITKYSKDKSLTETYIFTSFNPDAFPTPSPKLCLINKEGRCKEVKFDSCSVYDFSTPEEIAFFSKEFIDNLKK